MHRALKWSQENKGIRSLIIRLGYSPKTTLNKPFLLEYYSQLSFLDRGITEITPLPFVHLKELNVSNNYINKLPVGLPQSLEQLVLYNNKIDTIDPQVHLENLLYLNLGFNLLQNRSIDQASGLDFEKSFPALISLDLSFNDLQVLSDVTESLKHVNSLRMFGIQGNPLCLIRSWKRLLIEDMKQIKVLDLEDLKKDEDVDIDPKSDTFQALMGNLWGDTWAEEAAQQREEEAKGAGAKAGGKKKDLKKDAQAKGAKKPVEDKKPKKEEVKKPDPKNNKTLAGKKAEQEPTMGFDDGESSKMSGMVKSMVFDKHSDDDKMLTFKIEVKTLENIQPVFLEDLETEENKNDLEKL
jgi:hypothetical protein